MTRGNVFLIIDMQFPFVTADADGAYIQATVAETRNAKLRGDRIFLLEDRGGSPTHADIVDELHGYEHSRLMKGQWDGSLQVEMELTRLGLTPDLITACGAFAEECVIATLVGLRDRFPGSELEVIRKACCPRPTYRFSQTDWEAHSRRLGLKLA